MKLKFLFLLSIICLASLYSPAQEKTSVMPIDVSVSLKEPKISFYAKSILVDIKITNNSLPDVNTEQFDQFEITLSKTSDGKTIDKIESALFHLKPKVLNEGETFETQIDLNKLDWLDYSTKYPKAKYTPLLLGTYFLSVAVGNCVKILPENSLDLATHRPCESNRIRVDFLTPAKSK